MSLISKSFAAALMLVPVVAAPSLSATQALAQDAITLETIGAVRMASPAEARRRNEDAARDQRLQTARSASVSTRRADVAD